VRVYCLLYMVQRMTRKSLYRGTEKGREQEEKACQGLLYKGGVDNERGGSHPFKPP